MIKFLYSRESGFEDPLKLRRAETTRRVFSLELSRHKDLERLFAGNVNSLDVDLIEKRYLLSGGSDGFIIIYDILNPIGQTKCTCPSVGTVALNNRHRHKYSVETVLWYPLDTGLFTSSGTDKLLKVWDTNRLKPADEYEFSGIVYNHHMSPVATRHCLIAVATQSSSVKLVDLKSGSATHTLKGHSKAVLSVRWSPYNEFIMASSSSDSKVFLWDIRNAKASLFAFDQFNWSRKDKCVTSHDGHVNGLEFSSDGLHLASCGTDNKVRLWNTTNGQDTLVKFARVNNPGKRTIQFAITNNSSPDIIYIPNGAQIDALDTSSGKRLYTLHGHYNQVNCCYIHPESQELYSAGSDRNILVWVPEKANSDYESFLKGGQMTKKEKSDDKPATEVPRSEATADAWSSDEET